LQERNKDVALLRSESAARAAQAEAARREASRQADALRAEADQQRRRWAEGEAAAAALRGQAAEAAALRGQVAALRDQLLEARAEAERLRLSLSQRDAAGLAGLAGGNGNGSRPSSRASASSGSLASFPLALQPEAEGGGGGGRGSMPGSPMLRRGGAPPRAPSPTKTPAAARQPGFSFLDLDPLATPSAAPKAHQGS
jgi:hypothetical protein